MRESTRSETLGLVVMAAWWATESWHQLWERTKRPAYRARAVVQFDRCINRELDRISMKPRKP